MAGYTKIYPSGATSQEMSNTQQSYTPATQVNTTECGCKGKHADKDKYQQVMQLQHTSHILHMVLLVLIILFFLQMIFNK